MTFDSTQIEIKIMIGDSVFLYKYLILTVYYTSIRAADFFHFWGRVMGTKGSFLLPLLAQSNPSVTNMLSSQLLYFKVLSTTTTVKQPVRAIDGEIDNKCNLQYFQKSVWAFNK